MFSSQKSGDQISRQTDGKHHWSWLITVLKIGLSVFAFAIVAFSVDLSAAWERAANQSIPYVILSAAILSVQLLLGGLRWHAILARLGANPSLRDSVRLYYISAFFNAYLWGAVGGDMLRAWLTYRRQLSAKIAVNSVVLDRIAELTSDEPWEGYDEQDGATIAVAVAAADPETVRFVLDYEREHRSRAQVMRAAAKR